MNKTVMAKLPVLQLDAEPVAEIKPRPNYSNMGRKKEKFDLVKAYLDTPFNERMSLPLFRRENKIRRNEYLELKLEIEQQHTAIRQARVKDAQKWMNDSLNNGAASESLRTPPGAVGIEDDPVTWWRVRWQEINQAIFDSAVQGNPQSQKLAKQLAGELVEKQEIKIGLTAEERARRLFQAQEELKSEGYIDSCGKR